MRLKPVSVVSFLVLLLFRFLAGGNGQFIYNGFAGTQLDLDGMAVVEPDGKLALTNITSQLKGSAFHPTPLRFHKTNGTVARSFSATFVFAIVTDLVTVGGNGLAFFVAPTNNLSMALPSQFLGLFNPQNNGNASNHVFAVELDTILNPEFRDINSNHVGVDVNGLASVVAEPAGYYDDGTGDFKNLTLTDGDAMQVWVDYDGRSTVLNVTLAPVEAPRPKKPLISVTINLSPVLNGTAYVGLSSSTGPFRTRHYVLGWSFALDGAAPPLDYSNLPKPPRICDSKRRSKARDVILPVVTPILALVVVAGVSLLVWQRLRYAEPREEWEVEFGPHGFAYKDLYRATGSFDGKHLLGVGGFGRVYKGVLPASKKEVAVKVFMSHDDAKLGMKQFIAEVVSLGRLRHRNIVQLLGYCRRKGELILVYDYMPNGSLDNWLYDRNAPPLSWAQRLSAIRGVASGLLYLHEDWEKVVVHWDIKASNVLLDGEMNARLRDFGLAKLYDRGGTDPQTTSVVGTMGYLAPQLACTRRVTPATDVFAFGSFVLEVACGRRPIEHRAIDDNQLVLADWVLECWHNRDVTDRADPRLCGAYDVEEAAAVLRLGLVCSHPAPGARPSMRQVVQYLDGDMPMPEPAPTYRSFTAMALMQNAEDNDSCVASYPLSSATSVGASSVFFGR